MPKGPCILPSQSGSALVITLMVLIAVTILGIAAVSTSVVELKIARNEREIRETFYLAEGAAAEGVQRLNAMSAVDLNEQYVSWHHPRKALASHPVDFRDRSQWDVDGIGEDNGLQSPLAPETFIAAVEWKVATGGSLVQTESRLYQNRVYGLCDKYAAGTIVEIGYYLRY
ncbi:MAG: PilX N-terminal domain-containing pilus assembly protein [Desulfatitalea sp.]